MEPMDTHPLHEQVLVGVDAEGVAADAVILAHDLSKRLDAHVEYLHAVEFPHAVWIRLDRKQRQDVQRAYIDSARERTIRNLERTLREHGQFGAEVERRLHVEEGHASKALLTRAERIDATLIVLGPHTRHDLLDLGSTLRAVLAHAPVPVWIQTRTPGPIRRILTGIDLSNHSAQTLATACELATSLGVSVTALHCFSESEAIAHPGVMVGPTYVIERDRGYAREELERLAAEQGLDSLETEFCDGDPLGELCSRSSEFDLVVVGARGRTSLSRFLLGSTAQRILKRSKAPVLVVPEHAPLGQLDVAPVDEEGRVPASQMGIVQPFMI
jgi:nucleotide-binding universal stress UspA family protein